MTTGTSKTASLRPSLGKLGPALVAGVAYLDPGNFASNLASGALFHYSLVWVVLLANATAWFVQYLAAKDDKSLFRVNGKNDFSENKEIDDWTEEIAADLFGKTTVRNWRY